MLNNSEHFTYHSKGKFEDVLAAGFAMTAAAVASVTGEQGDDFVGEVDRLGSAGLLDGDGRGRR